MSPISNLIGECPHFSHFSLRGSVFFQQRREVGERGVGGARPRIRHAGRDATLIQLPLMLVVVAVETKQLPVAAVRRVAVVVVVLVMDRQLVNVGMVEFPRATPADPREQLQRLAAIALVPLRAGTLRIGDHSIESREIGVDLLPRYHAARRFIGCMPRSSADPGVWSKSSGRFSADSPQPGAGPAPRLTAATDPGNMSAGEQQ